MSKSLAVLKITLNHVEPKVMRRVIVPADIRLDWLHLAIQAVMGWTSSHLYEFRIAAAALDSSATIWRDRYAKGDVAGDAPATIINTCLKRLSRRLVPLASTARGAYGHDVNGCTPQGTMIPSLYDAPRLAKMSPVSKDRWMLEVQLIQDRNRVSDALTDCRVLVEDTLRQLR